MALLAVSACALPIFAGDLNAAAGDSQSNPYIVNIVKEQTWQYTPTFPSSLSPTITIEKQGSAWTSTDGTYASVSSGKVSISSTGAIAISAVSGDTYDSASGPYSDLLQTQDYVAYAASAAVEYGNRSYSDRLKMSFKKFLRRDK